MAAGITCNAVKMRIETNGLGVSPLRGAGLSRCASSHRGTGVSTLTGFHP